MNPEESLELIEILLDKLLPDIENVCASDIPNNKEINTAKTGGKDTITVLLLLQAKL